MNSMDTCSVVESSWRCIYRRSLLFTPGTARPVMTNHRGGKVAYRKCNWHCLGASDNRVALCAGELTELSDFGFGVIASGSRILLVLCSGRYSYDSVGRSLVRHL